MQTQFQAAINQLCAEKNLDKKIVIDAIENAVALAYKKDFGSPRQITKVILGDDISQMKIFLEKTVVDKIEDYDLDILHNEARTIRPDAEVGDTVYQPVSLEENFGRVAAQTAKQVITQKLQEEERKMMLDKFKKKEGELITAKVQKADGQTVLLDIDGVSTLLHYRQQIPGERYFTGQRLRVLLEKVETTPKGPQLKITRASKDFILALFEQEIPEMKDEIVYVAKIVREPGVRCKLAVASDDGSIDPVGAFVGQKGSRINSVMEEVGEERLDIIQYHQDPERLLIAALSPARVIKTEIIKGDKGEPRIKVYVPDEDRAITIGKRGQNIRLAGNLIDMQVDVITHVGPIPQAASKTVEKAPKKREITEDITIDKLVGVDEAVIETLSDMGLTQVKQFEGLKSEDLEQLELTPEQAKSVVKSVERFING